MESRSDGLDSTSDCVQLERALATLRVEGDPLRHDAFELLARLAASGYRHASDPLLKHIPHGRRAEDAVRSALLDPFDIDDAVQSTLIVVAEKITTFEGQAKFSTWLHRVAYNEAFMVVRWKQRKSGPTTNEVPELDPSVRQFSSLIADQETVQAALSKLVDDYREILYLREDLQMSYDEIADQFSVPGGTVRNRLSRANSTLFDLLLGHASQS